MISEVHNCDNMELMAKYPDNYFELAIVDPPYGISADKGAGRSLRKKIKSGKIHGGDWDSAVPSEEYFNELFRVSKNQIIWGGIILIYRLANTLPSGIRARLCTEEILLSASLLGSGVEELESLKNLQIS